jgi:hypothetical protein
VTFGGGVDIFLISHGAALIMQRCSLPFSEHSSCKKKSPGWVD